MAFYKLSHLILHEIDRFGCFMLKSGFFSKSLVLCLTCLNTDVPACRCHCSNIFAMAEEISKIDNFSILKKLKTCELPLVITYFIGKVLLLSQLQKLPACRRLLFPLLHAEKGRKSPHTLPVQIR